MPLPVEVARLMLITKVQVVWHRAYSGVQLSTIERIIWHIENHVTPVVPKKGSVGASGDLAPLSHLFLPSDRLWAKFFTRGKKYRLLKYLLFFQIAPVQLGAKEGLALINGTQFILSFSVKAVQRMHNCLDAADIIGAMSLEALTGTKAPFDERLHELRPLCRK
jgi:histidine ammonia-lyase